MHILAIFVVHVGTHIEYVLLAFFGAYKVYSSEWYEHMSMTFSQ